jgi:hypothetical protein
MNTCLVKDVFMLNSIDDKLNAINIAKQLRKLRIINENQYQQVYWAIFFYNNLDTTIKGVT